MEQFLRWLLDNPLILILLGGWLLSMVGNVMARAAQKAAREQQKQKQNPKPAQSGPSQPALRSREEASRPLAPPAQQAQSVASRPALPRGAELSRPLAQPQQHKPAQAGPSRPALSRGAELSRPLSPQQQPQQQPQPQRAPSPAQPKPEEIAREIRRIMGMEVEPRPKPAARAPARPPAPAPEPAPQRTTLREEMAVKDRETVHLSRLRDQQSKVGKRIERRHLGHLETRLTRGAEPVRRKVPEPRRRRAGSLLDLSNPASAFVAMEVLGRPKALRSPRDDAGASP